MAKNQMKCVFSVNQCKNCPVYIGRHYFLCYYGKTGKRGNADKLVSRKSDRNFKIPDMKRDIFDPFKTTL